MTKTTKFETIQTIDTKALTNVLGGCAQCGCGGGGGGGGGGGKKRPGQPGQEQGQ
jgi:hypothetical protein